MLFASTPGIFLVSMNLPIGIAEILEKIQVKGLVWTNLPKISASMGIIWEG